MVTRRAFLAAAAGLAATGPATRAMATPGGDMDVLSAGDPGYARLASRGYNPRFRATPREILVPHHPKAVILAVQRAVDAGARIGLRSGGHCFEDFVDGPQTRVLIDLEKLGGLGFDREHNSFSLGASVDLGTAYRRLARGWGVTIPGGTCLGVGAAGHISGGGFGGLSRQFGAVADHVYGVEVVVVDGSGQARPVLATRDGPHRDLWWAHTGGGGGNFGVITRFLLRSAGSDGHDPRTALPRPPARIRVGKVHLAVPTISAFTAFVGNFLRYFSAHSTPGSPGCSMYGTLHAGSLHTGGVRVETYYNAEARHIYDEFAADLSRGVWPPPVPARPVEGPFLDATLQYCTPRGAATSAIKTKSAFLRAPFSDRQLRTLHRFLSDPVIVDGGSGIELFTVGGQINAVSPAQTALAERSSIAKLQMVAAWPRSRAGTDELAWVRNFYRTLYADTGGVPKPDDANGGCYVNYPDSDMAAPEWNPDVPWHVLYHQTNYARLQEAKARWDPLGCFTHELGVTT
ncbi:FAD-binding protein [Gordonia sp. NB41Y]|uniref:FAD-binding protein n=1 Tax=Gordonia sp. NB41Y TaxID=875808 RepID=UPI0006B1D540|nr:FAD-binding protein [Gordonia sp. NB41Y]WLP92703.1 FAD-binding protein [Gordonia sp. NB41Y]